MRISAQTDSAARLAGVLRRQAARAAIDGMAREMAEALRAEAARELAEIPGIGVRDAQVALTVAPLPNGTGYAVTASSEGARNAEFGSTRRVPDPWFSRAVAAALPLINHIGRTLIRRLGAASRSHSGD